ncbi:hypothetical protein F4803DRAFT_539766 [Xylaria telfairii]|nr:hypothetical protein F4803DRAFT_539766 [Xylaria telfairii]
MEFDLSLYPEGGRNSLHTQNVNDEEFRLILAMTKNTEESPLTMKVTIKEVHHGKLKWERRNYKGTLLVFHFQFKSKVESRRYKTASITLEFYDAGGRASRDPAVFKVAPSSEEDRYLNRTESPRERTVGVNANVKPLWIDLGVALENKDTISIKSSARLTTDTHLGDRKSSGTENAVTWSMEENTGQGDGIPSFLQAAVLLRRTTDQPFRMQLRVTSGVDWKSTARRLMLVKSDVDKVIDPIQLEPRIAQEGVDNFDVSGLSDKDLLAMEKLPIANLYKVVHPQENS